MLDVAGCRLGAYAGLEVVAVEVDEERAIVAPASNARVANVGRTAATAGRVKPIHRVARRCSKRDMHRASCRSVRITPE